MANQITFIKYQMRGKKEIIGNPSHATSCLNMFVLQLFALDESDVLYYLWWPNFNHYYNMISDHLRKEEVETFSYILYFFFNYKKV
jgi:hypothetical protein